MVAELRTKVLRDGTPLPLSLPYESAVLWKYNCLFIYINMGILERIKEIELEMSRTQKNKATTTHLGMLKSQLSRLRNELMEPAAGGMLP